MNMPLKHDPTGQWPEGELATATDFVRHFGHYAASSQNKPVYIAQHGRVGWALLSAAQMTRLAQIDGDTAGDARFDILLDVIPTIVVLIDAEFRITRINLAGRYHFQVSENNQMPIGFRTLLHEYHRDFIGDICDRVLSSGLAETFEIDSARYPDRILQFQIVPFQSGLAILADVITHSVQLRRASSAITAASQAADAFRNLGHGRIDVRGSITSVNANFAAMSNSTASKIIGLRLSALFEQKSRTSVHDAIDALLTDGNAFSMEATLLTGTAAPLLVTISAAPERNGATVHGAVFMVLAKG